MKQYSLRTQFAHKTVLVNPIKRFRMIPFRGTEAERNWSQNRLFNSSTALQSTDGNESYKETVPSFLYTIFIPAYFHYEKPSLRHIWIKVNSLIQVT